MELGSPYHSNTNILLKYRGIGPMVLFKNSVLENFAKFKGNHLFRDFIFSKVASLRPVVFHEHSCFLMSVAKSNFLHNITPVAASLNTVLPIVK